MDAFKTWWAQASTRDQLALFIGAGGLLLYVMFMMVLKPVQEMRLQEQKKIAALRNNLESVRSLAGQVMAKAQPSSRESGARTLESLIQTTVSANGLQISSMNASGDSGVRLRFDEAPFEKVLKWLYEMEVSHAMQIKDLSIAAAANSGNVTVNLRLHQQ